MQHAPSAFARSLKWGAVACVSIGWFHIISKGVSISGSTGGSMKPTFSPNDIFIRESLSYKFFGRPIQEGDIVAFRSPSSPKHFIMKRVIAPGGSYLPSGRFIPPGMLWVEGDNAAASVDSNQFGPIPTNLVQARVLARIYPTFTWASNPTRSLPRQSPFSTEN